MDEILVPGNSLLASARRAPSTGRMPALKTLHGVVKWRYVMYASRQVALLLLVVLFAGLTAAQTTSTEIRRAVRFVPTG